ncbi:hypothetical protein ACJ41O_000873 [Fusarium nematophilum]
MLGPIFYTFALMMALSSVNTAYVLYCIGGDAAKPIFLANLCVMIIMVLAMSTLGWARITVRSYDLTNRLLAFSLMFGSWCLLCLNVAHLSASIYRCRRATDPYADGLQYCIVLGLSSAGLEGPLGPGAIAGLWIGLGAMVLGLFMTA